MQLDTTTLNWVAQRRRPTLTRFFRTVSFTGEGRTWFAVGIVCNVLGIAGVQLAVTRMEWLRAMLCPLVAWLVGIVVKRAVGRLRPTRAGGNDPLLGAIPRDGSFPSSHASTAVAFAVALAWSGHPFALPVAIWAAFVGASRIYLGVHWLTDVLGGIAIGMLVGSAVLWVPA